MKAGVGKVFWGVTESAHLVDIINQTDGVEDLDGEDKLGQPMLHLSLFPRAGTLELFVLPGFRERTFAGVDGRLRPGLVVNAADPLYESSAEDEHVDGAIRWSQILGDFDLGLSYFYGTSREPILTQNIHAVELVPYYPIIHQAGLDLQFTRGGWLWKLETIYQDSELDAFLALAGGFEFSFVGVFGSAADVGVIAEVLHDERQAPTAFEDDLFLGTRLALNDVQSTELLAGVIQDLDEDTRFFNLEASRRLGDRYKLSIQARYF
ncbi:MAG: hypothetical protein ACI9QL_004754 [Candidatus Omnitrophota bacterium]